MTYKTRKRIWPVAVVSLAVFGLLAAAVALYVMPAQPAQAHGCDEADALAQAQCITDHEGAGLDPNSEHEHDPNEPPVLTGTPLSDVSIRVQQTLGPISVADVFEDPDEDDTLRYRASSDNENVANATIAGSQMTIVAGDVRGSARITVTAYDGKGGMVSTGFDVTVAEAYALTSSNPGDPMLPAVPDDDDTVDPYEEMRDIPHSAVYLVIEGEDGYPQDYDAHFSLGVAGSLEDVTVTITATEELNITIRDSDGLIGAGFVDEEETDLEGSLTVKATDQGSRAFEIEGACQRPGGWAHILVEDKDLAEVAEGAIYCKPAEEVVPDDDEFLSDMMTVVSYNDWDHWAAHKTVSDGFLVDDPDHNVDHMVNEKHNKMGVLVRDEPVVDTYQLAISEKEYLELLPDGSPRRTKEQAEEDQHTIEVQVGMSDVQLTVTSRLEGPAYIRFLDSDMEPFGTDIDEDPKWAGANVVGLDSQGHLALNLTPDLSKAKALAYDQYQVVIPGLATGNAYLEGVAGTYYQGTFRFFNPCPSEDHHFYVEVYESEGKYLKTTEKVLCVTSLRPGPTGLVFEIDSDLPGEGVLRFDEARNAGDHTVLLIDAENGNIVHEEVEATSPVMFNEDDNVGLNNGWTYHIVVLAEGTNNQYTADAVKYYSVRWLRDADGNPLADVPVSKDAPNTGDGHVLCQVEDAQITALLSNCDTNTDPTAVGSIAAVTVTAGEMADAIALAGYFSDANDDALTYGQSSSNPAVATARIATDDSYPGSPVHTLIISGVAVGEATITVTASDGMGGEDATQTIMVTVEAGMLTAPTLMATPGSGSVTLSWDTAGGVEYTVAGVRSDASPVKEGSTSNLIWVPNVTGTSHTVTGLTSGAEYWFTVASCGDTECSVWKWSDVQTVTPD